MATKYKTPIIREMEIQGCPAIVTLYDWGVEIKRKRGKTGGYKMKWPDQIRSLANLDPTAGKSNGQTLPPSLRNPNAPSPQTRTPRSSSKLQTEVTCKERGAHRFRANKSVCADCGYLDMSRVLSYDAEPNPWD